MILNKTFYSLEQLNTWIGEHKVKPINIETITTREAVGQTDIVEMRGHLSGGDLIYVNKTTHKLWYQL